KARTLIHLGRVGALSTMSHKASPSRTASRDACATSSTALPRAPGESACGLFPHRLAPAPAGLGKRPRWRDVVYLPWKSGHAGELRLVIPIMLLHLRIRAADFSQLQDQRVPPCAGNAHVQLLFRQPGERAVPNA